MSKYQDIKEQAFESNRQIPEMGLAIYTFGNVSAFDAGKAVFAIKPSGVPYRDLKVEQMVVMDLEDKVVEGSLRPSSDTKTHRVLYQSFPDIRGITHTHSAYAVAWSQSLLPVPIFGTTHADHLAQDIPCTEVMSDEMIDGDYEEQTGKQIIDTFKSLSYKEVEMVLVACHGPFTWGMSAEKSLYNSAVLEEIAKMALLTKQINPQTAPLKTALRNKHYQRKHGKNAYYGQN
jgi:L-ribulose-5-phosphate 4-epimerase